MELVFSKLRSYELGRELARVDYELQRMSDMPDGVSLSYMCGYINELERLHNENSH